MVTALAAARELSQLSLDYAFETAEATLVERVKEFCWNVRYYGVRLAFTWLRREA